MFSRSAQVQLETKADKPPQSQTYTYTYTFTAPSDIVCLAMTHFTNNVAQLVAMNEPVISGNTASVQVQIAGGWNNQGQCTTYWAVIY